MRALIDADVLRYEIGYSGEGEDGPLSFQHVSDLLDTKIAQILDATECYDPPTLYLTDGSNFRDEIAVSKPYKGNRKSKKPFHFENLTAYMKNRYYVESVDGLEADDLMALEQLKGTDLNDTCICTRDKDLLMIPGWHYGWECGKQRERHKHFVTYEGWIEMVTMDDKAKTKKLKGEGMAFFYSQLLTGDSVDNIPGLPKCGPNAAYKILGDLEEHEMLDAVRAAYHEKGFDDDYLLEQGRLLWMTRDLTEDGSPVLWHINMLD